MPGDFKNQVQEQESFTSENSFSSTTEQVQDLVKHLVDNYQTARRGISARELAALSQGHDLAGHDLEAYETWLADAHNYFRDASNRDLTLTFASEWVLDNYYIIHQALLQIHEDLPAGYYNQLPKLIKNPLAGLPRIYAIGRGILSYQNYLLNIIDLQTILIELQKRIPLTMGELWALPIFLRYSLIENLAHELESVIHPQSAPDLPVFPSILPATNEPSKPNPPPNGNSAANGTVANSILSLRTISEQDWNDFFESVSCLEKTLRQDPAGIYSRMDFKTRDIYRKEIEGLSFATGREENELGEIALDLARKSYTAETKSTRTNPETDGLGLSTANEHAHIGGYLLGKGRPELEAQVGYHPGLIIALKRWGFKNANTLYQGSILLLATLIFFLLALITQLTASLGAASLFQKFTVLGLALALLVPVLTVSTSLVNWLVTLLIKPRILPKLHFKDEIPAPFQTLVVIPALITSHEEIESLVHQLELHYLRNPEPGLLFALLTDFCDANSETLPEDEDLINYAAAAIEKLNAKYEPSTFEVAAGDRAAQQFQPVNDIGAEQSEHEVRKPAPLFYLLHRKRLWNPSEGKWMGWERKRGKLHELNLLLRGETNLSFISLSKDIRTNGALQGVHFVITLDADTVLPRGAARRLAGALAHPLNVAKFDDSTGKVISGYTILQPRMEIHPRSANYSWFTRIFAGDTGLDLYTRAVSDAYQDLFGEGSYVGKGIYDVDAFERSVDKRIPENTVLSHDLLEGIMGRAGLVTDITLIEDYPPNYFVQAMRLRRWIRGDWQLLPWLLQPGKFKALFSAIDRWKMLDNLLRAMLAPTLFVIFILSMISLPNLAGLGLAAILLSLGIPLLTSMAQSTLQTLSGEILRTAFRPLGLNLMRWLLAIAFLPYEAYIALDAIITTIYRLAISHRDLLQWTTAAQAARLFGLQVYRNTAWLRMTAFAFLALILTAGIQLVYMVTGRGAAPALAFAAPMLLLWTFSPLIAQWINQPIKERRVPLSEEQTSLLRQVTRRTWGFFERFVGPEDHWLPPDHFQETPVGVIAHHTSPTNIGLLLTSTVAAYDFGYLDQLGLATRLSTTMDTLDRLERFRGHFLNWYDTMTLKPLQPRYISTVDSGNLAASFIVTAQACKSMLGEPVFRWDLWQGYLDSLSNLTEILAGMRTAEIKNRIEEINRRISGIHAEILSVRAEPSRWYALFQTVNGRFWQELSGLLIKLVEVGRIAFDLETLRKLQEVVAQVERHHLAVSRTIDKLVPWIPLMEQSPALFTETKYLRAFNKLRAGLPYNPALSQIPMVARAGLSNIAALGDLLKADQPIPQPDTGPEKVARDWLDALDEAMVTAVAYSESLMSDFAHIAVQAEQYLSEMDFQFLYNSQRRVFHIGFNLDASQLDNNYYDLLASEARIASIIALAKGEVPQSHWLQLGRPLTRVERAYVLLSWSGTMFEYLMPPLFLRSYPGTLLAESTQGAIFHQISYGRTKGIPWGISESGFYLFDANQNYQYRAFGVPGLGFKRGLSDDLVIAPYASLMAIKYDPHAVAQNLADLIKYSSFGVYGLYEAIDFTADRLPMNDTSKVVQEYMAHHQGMILMAMVNFFHNDIMVRRMHSDPRIQSVDLLLQEQIPQSVPLVSPNAEDVKGIQRLTTVQTEIDAWSVPIQTAIPQVNLLSNGNYSVLISNMGGGYSTWNNVDLTRWQPDGVLDPWGTWIYIQDMDLVTDRSATGGGLWSAGHQPVPGDAVNVQVTFFPHMAVFRRTENGITSTMEVTVSPNEPLEIRRIHLHNPGSSPRHLRLTSYGEVILTQQATDTRHPAFNKLFIESEFVPELDLQIFTRRPRSDQEEPIYMGHMLVVDDKGGSRASQSGARHDADRERFIGRGRTLRSPAALVSEQYLSGTTGATLDPIFALGKEIELHPHESAELAYLVIAGESREAVLAMAVRYRGWDLIQRTFHQSNIATQSWLGKQNYTTAVFKDTLQVLSALLYPFKALRALPVVIAANQLGQSGLWRFGISGDHPILLVELDDPKQIDLIREILQIHEFLRSRRILVDVVILNRQQTEYGAELNGMLYRLVSRMNGEQWLNQRGGIFILYADQMNAAELTLLQTAARVLLSGERGSLDDQMPAYPIPVHHLPEFTPTRTPDGMGNPVEEDPLPLIAPLLFSNGYGGFTRNGQEYVIEPEPGKHTPAPWINVIGYPNFGFMVSEAGSQSTWAVNSGENRLTPWSNDPVRDPSGEVLYLRDEETGDVWTPTPLPAGSDQPYRVTHGSGYTIFDHHSHGLRQQLTLFASPEDPVKIIHLRVQNTWNHTRRITATQYIEWVLGTTHAAATPYIIPEYDAGEACMLATNPYNAGFGERAAFLIASKPLHGLTADRTEFFGRGGTPILPAALRRIGLENRITPGEDACAVLQLHLDLPPGAVEEIYFVLGQGSNKEQALMLAKKYHDPAYVGAALERTHAFWDRLLGTVQVHTPQPAADLILNRWMLYQSLSCRIWGRSAFYQPSGAFGFRDQLQDVLALLPIDPAISRGQILNAAQRQFEEGDVLHWWHPPSSRGVRTRISDDLLWLPYVTAVYIESTGDASILEEKIPFLQSLPLKKGENERYNDYPQTKETYPLIEHCHRAIAKGATRGPHGLPLIGAGDWNDGLNQVGIGGKGESIWLAWFVCDVLERFAALCEQRGDIEIATNYRTLAKQYTAALEQSAWDGAWYRRAFYDDGTPLGSSQDLECQIDAIAQSWAVISKAGDPAHTRQAMQSVLDHLVLPQDRLSLLFTPPFDKTDRNPGYIKGYLPGIRENGGQYTHGAVWTAWAFSQLGDGKQAGELFDMLNPIFHSDTPERASEYRVEPYVMCADIYSKPPYLRRGGWTWYTGSAGWMYRLGLEAILGFKKTGSTLRIDPVIPPDWDGFEITYQFQTSIYHIKVFNPEHVAHNIWQVSLDGDSRQDGLIPLVDDGKEHNVEVTGSASQDQSLAPGS